MGHPSALVVGVEVEDVLQVADGKATGKVAEATKSLHAVLAEAQKHNYVHYELEARLALCEIEAKTDRSAARAHEMALEKQAQARGFGMIARKSAALRRRIG